jgi:hypothetical protein
VTDKATSIIHTVSGGVFALTGAALGALVGAVVGRGTEGGMARGASLGALSGAVVFMEALNATRGLLSPPEHWVRSPTPFPHATLPRGVLDAHPARHARVDVCVCVQTGHAQRSTALDLEQLGSDIRAGGHNSSSLPALLIQARRPPPLLITTMT